jgi:hypothetical protein
MCPAFWNDLKRGHFIDLQTRAMVITLQLRSNNMGVASRTSLLFELTSAGAVLPSFVHLSAPMLLLSSEADATEMERHEQTVLKACLYSGFAIAAFFILVECFELYKVGLLKYAGDLWNVADWLEKILFFYMFEQITAIWNLPDGAVNAVQAGRCSQLCEATGYFDNHEVFTVTMSTRNLIATPHSSSAACSTARAPSKTWLKTCAKSKPSSSPAVGRCTPRWEALRGALLRRLRTRTMRQTGRRSNAPPRAARPRPARPRARPHLTSPEG